MDVYLRYQGKVFLIRYKGVGTSGKLKLPFYDFVKEIKEDQIPGKVILNVPFEDLAIKNISLPKLSKTELNHAIDAQKNLFLQSASHINQYQKVFVKAKSTNSSDKSKSTNLLLSATYLPPNIKVARLLPDPIAIVNFFRLYDDYKDEKEGLFVLEGPTSIDLIYYGLGQLKNYRSVPVDSFALTVLSDLLTTAQNKFQSSELTMGAIDKIYVLGSSAFLNKFKNLKKDLPLQLKLFSDYFENTERSGLHLSYHIIGLGLLHWPQLNKNDSDWNFVTREKSIRKQLTHALLISLPLWPLFLLLMVMGDLKDIESKIRRTNSAIDSIRHKYRKVAEVSRSVNDMTDFFQGKTNVNSPGDWLELMSLFDRKRERGVIVSNIFGRLEQIVSIKGRALNYDQVTRLMKQLEDDALIEKVQLISCSEDKNTGGVYFQLAITPIKRLVSSTEAEVSDAN